MTPHSAKVRIWLELGDGRKLEVAKSGPEDLILRESCWMPRYSYCRLVTEIDGIADDESIELSDGLRGEPNECVRYIRF